MKYALLFTFLWCVFNLKAQDLPRASPAANIEQKIGLTWVTVSYSRPAAKNRAIWGGLIPFGKVWRTGANEPTLLIFDDAVIIENKKVSRGQYALFSIPSKGGIKFMLNANSAQWGSDDYDATQNVLEFEVKSTTRKFNEHLTFSFDNLTQNSADLCLSWANTAFCFEVKADIKSKALKNIEEAIQFAQEGDYLVYLRAVNFSIETGFYLQKANDWVDMAIQVSNEAWDVLWVKANLLEKMENTPEAILFGEKCLEAMKDLPDHDELKKSYSSIIQTWKNK